jgi:hypothetical protein
VDVDEDTDVAKMNKKKLFPHNMTECCLVTASIEQGSAGDKSTIAALPWRWHADKFTVHDPITDTTFISR